MNDMRISYNTQTKMASTRLQLTRSVRLQNFQRDPLPEPDPPDNGAADDMQNDGDDGKAREVVRRGGRRVGGRGKRARVADQSQSLSHLRPACEMHVSLCKLDDMCCICWNSSM